MPCAMSSLRGASGVVGCDRVVCPLVLHATTIAHLDVRLCTDLFFLLCVMCVVPAPVCPCLSVSVPWLWCCGCVPLLPACAPCVVCAWLCVVLCLPSLSCPACGTALSSTLPATYRPVIPAPIPPCIYGVYIRLSHTGSYIVAYFSPCYFHASLRAHSKSRPLKSEYGFQKSA